MPSACQVGRVEGRYRDAAAGRIATQLVERHQPQVAVAGGVLHRLGRHRRGELLPARQQACPLVVRHAGAFAFAQQHLAHMVQHRRFGAAEAPPRGGHRPVEVAPVGGTGRLAHTQVGPVDRKTRCDFGQRQPQAVAGEVAAAAVGPRDPVHRLDQPVQLREQRAADDQPLALVRDLGEVLAHAGERPVALVQHLDAAGVDEEPIDQRGEAMAGVAVHRPLVRQRLVLGQDLLDHQVQRAWLAAGHLRLPDMAGLQPLEVLLRVRQAVGMVDAQRVQVAVLQPLQHPRMRGFEDFGTFHAQRRQRVDVEEAPVVDVVARHVPVGQPPGLPGGQPVQQVEAGRVARGAVEALHAGGDPLRQPGVAADQAGQVALVDGGVAHPRAALVVVRAVARRQALEGGEQRRDHRVAVAVGSRPARAAGAARRRCPDSCPGRSESGDPGSATRTRRPAPRSAAAVRPTPARARSGRPAPAAARGRASPVLPAPIRCRKSARGPRPGHAPALPATRRCRPPAPPCGWAPGPASAPCRAGAARGTAARSRPRRPPPGSARGDRRCRSRGCCPAAPAGRASCTGG